MSLLTIGLIAGIAVVGWLVLVGIFSQVGPHNGWGLPMERKARVVFLVMFVAILFVGLADHHLLGGAK